MKETSELKQHIINSSNEMNELKEKFSKYIKDNSEKTILLKTKFDSENANKKEIIELNEKINELRSKNISLRENILALEKMKDFHKEDEKLSKTEEENSEKDSEKKTQEIKKDDEIAEKNITQKIIDDILSLNLGKDIEEKIIKKLNKK